MNRWAHTLFAGLLGLLGVGVVGAFGATAQAQERGASAAVPGEVLIVLATEADGVVDPRLQRVPALRAAPFDRYRSMALLSSPRVRLALNQPEVIELPNGRSLRLVLLEITSEGRYRVQISLNRPGQRDYLPGMSAVASPGSPVFIAGQSFREGTLVIGIRLDRRAR